MNRIVGLLAALLGVAAALGAGLAWAQSSGAGAEVRVEARRLADGRVEFAVAQRADGEWSDRILPRQRYFPATGEGRWLRSSPVTAGGAEVRVEARRLADGRIEFAVARRTGGEWGDRILPRQRYFPATGEGRWLRSSPVVLPLATAVATPTPDDPAAAPTPDPVPDEVRAACRNGVAVPAPDANPGLVADCETLLVSKDTLRGKALLDWSADTPMREWDGVEITGAQPLRVRALNIPGFELLGGGPLSVKDRHGGKLTGSIPPELGRLANLEALYLLGNELTGSIPPELGRLANLEALHLLGNELAGSIPPELGRLASLERLDLSNNSLTGSIPLELGQLANLRGLWLGDNSLTGSIPPELGQLANLQGLWLYDNSLTGSIPPELGQLANLQELWLGDNSLTGSIPPELGRLANLEALYLGHSELTGSITPELSQLANLRGLWLGHNSLTGSIPPELGRLANLWLLELNDNELIGSIPPELGRLTNLRQLTLNDNELTGCIPQTLIGNEELEIGHDGLPPC